MVPPPLTISTVAIPCRWLLGMLTRMESGRFKVSVTSLSGSKNTGCITAGTEGCTRKAMTS
jgi:hypothetical protein